MNVSTEALDWIRKAESDLAAAGWLTDSDQACPIRRDSSVNKRPRNT